MKITSFAIFKNDNATGSQPQYRMIGKPDGADKEEKSVDLAGLWIKEHNGNKYYSGKMKGAFTKDDGTKLEGYVIITEREYEKLTSGDIDPENIPFD